MAGSLLHYEDFTPGETCVFGAFEMTRDLIREYALEWDPQPFHLDDEAARNSVLGGLCASGWQVCAIMNRMMVDAYANKAAGMGSFGIEKTRWMKPVYVGDVLSLKYTILDKRKSQSKPDMGIVRMHWEMIDQGQSVKTDMVGVNLFKVRDAAVSDAAT